MSKNTVTDIYTGETLAVDQHGREVVITRVYKRTSVAGAVYVYAKTDDGRTLFADTLTPASIGGDEPEAGVPSTPDPDPEPEPTGAAKDPGEEEAPAEEIKEKPKPTRRRKPKAQADLTLTA